MRKVVTILVVAACLFSTSANAVSVKAKQGQILSVSSTIAKSGSLITVTGNNFDESVGIYLAFCVIPKKNVAPSPCGGGVNKSGVGDASFWISSNPPPYGIGLAIEFLPGGRFSEKVQVSRKIGKFDCTKVRCAITVRADHLRNEDRSFDIFIPVKIK